ncbi:hypothetical protein [Ruminococcus flavefaciens]|uniref:Uncharacterized protein n=1 Tax=Ruminococcus flavefaciens 007c TaxID=1341157 RepID=W7V103_RUMFL|nr:hypothetical protein [Ruminococcus flavefaciens]EWM54487.1 hypothetical protein RF007C_01700 [Ruminococcus flavefaciens 007c]
MSKGNGFFSNLKKSTKITLVSCGCFIALTALILLFFVFFPITPSEKVISSIGRESIYKQSDSVTTTVQVTTTVNDDIVVAKGKHTTTTAVRTTSKKYTTHKLTSGAGFYTGQKIPSGDYPNEFYYSPTTTTVAEGGYTGTGEAVTNPGGGVVPPEGGTGTGTETPVVPPEGGAGTGSDTPAPVEGGAGSGGDASAPVEGGGAAAAPAE